MTDARAPTHTGRQGLEASTLVPSIAPRVCATEDRESNGRWSLNLVQHAFSFNDTITKKNLLVRVAANLAELFCLFALSFP